MKLAEFRCLSCNFEWKCQPQSVECPKCEHIYVLWTNFDSDFDTKNKTKKGKV